MTTEEKVNYISTFLKGKFADFNPDPIPPPPAPEVTKPIQGYVREGGWRGANLLNREVWTIVNMTDRPQLLKIVDNNGRNIATDFTSKENAQVYIDYYKVKTNEMPARFSNEIIVPAPAPSPSPAPAPAPTTDAPYPSTGRQLDSTQRGPTIRHYSSGKPDDKTIEKNVRNIPFENYQFLVDVKVTTIEHDDTISLKYGGRHMEEGWFDNTINFKDGLVALGTEKKHPNADLRLVKGGKIGSVLNRMIKIAGVYRSKENKCEMWTNVGDDQGWVKQVEGVNVGGFNPESPSDEAQLRIDGFEAVPIITRAVVQEIA